MNSPMMRTRTSVGMIQGGRFELKMKKSFLIGQVGHGQKKLPSKGMSHLSLEVCKQGLGNISMGSEASIGYE